MSAKLFHQENESFFFQPPQANECKPFSEAKTRVNLFHLFSQLVSAFPCVPADVGPGVIRERPQVLGRSPLAPLPPLQACRRSRQPCHSLASARAQLKLNDHLSPHSNPRLAFSARSELESLERLASPQALEPPHMRSQAWHHPAPRRRPHGGPTFIAVASERPSMLRLNHAEDSSRCRYHLPRLALPPRKTLPS